MSGTVLIVGSGGREHAIARALADAKPTPECYACGGTSNPGITRLTTDFARIDVTNTTEVVGYADEVGATVAVIGPDPALDAGLADALDDAGVYAFGPCAADARIETDKVFQREFMAEHDIPGCPEFETFDDAEAACEYIDEYDGDLAVKPAGLTGGKGVRVIGEQVTAEEAKEYVRESEHERFVLEERLDGEEFTLHAFVANGTVRVCPATQDHGHAYEGDTGPNTGGMGSYNDASPPLPFMTEDDYDEAVEIIEATIDALDDYKGFLCGQFMLTADGVEVVEFNARFGDPEAMNVFPILQTDFTDVLVAAREGRPLPQFSFAEQATVCKYAVPEEYPTDPTPGRELDIDPDAAGDALLFYGSVNERDGGVYTTTSRAFAYVGIGDTIADAEQAVDDAFATTELDGLRVRHDIAKPDLVQRRIEHMSDLRD